MHPFVSLQKLISIPDWVVAYKSLKLVKYPPIEPIPRLYNVSFPSSFLFAISLLVSVCTFRNESVWRHSSPSSSRSSLHTLRQSFKYIYLCSWMTEISGRTLRKNNWVNWGPQLFLVPSGLGHAKFYPVIYPKLVTGISGDSNLDENQYKSSILRWCDDTEMM